MTRKWLDNGVFLNTYEGSLSFVFGLEFRVH